MSLGLRPDINTTYGNDYRFYNKMYESIPQELVRLITSFIPRDNYHTPVKTPLKPFINRRFCIILLTEPPSDEFIRVNRMRDIIDCETIWCRAQSGDT